MTDSIFSQIRECCKRVADLSSHVEINFDRIESYAALLPLEKIMHPELDPNSHYLGRHQDTLAFVLILDSVNFGSGYFPHMRKRPGMSGYFTTASSLHDFFKKHGPLTAEQLAEITIDRCTRIFDQDPANRIIQELMQHFATALNDLGRYVLDDFKGSYSGLVEAADSSAGRLVELLRKMPYFDDRVPYGDLEVPFFKRAQIVAADLAVAFEGKSWGYFRDMDQLTIFADNLVPHVLRMDGLLRYDPSLLARIEAETPIDSGSTEEVEIRACAVHTVELIKQSLSSGGPNVTSSQLDYFLWNRGQQPHYKAVPRHRARSVYY